MTISKDTKVEWSGVVLGVQPRIRLTRSFDQRQHSYLGYVLRVRGDLDGEPGEFTIAIGKAAPAKHEFRTGDQVAGRGVPVADPRKEPADLFKASGLKARDRGEAPASDSPPFQGAPPDLTCLH